MIPKFRGKSTADENNDEWVYGNLVYDRDLAIIVSGIDEATCEYIAFEDFCSVDIDTVGQSTGLFDKNGVEIFEGDLLSLDGEMPHIVKFGQWICEDDLGYKIKNIGFYLLKTKLPFEYSVHHLNENKLDARKENLSLVLNKTHNSKHNKGRIFSESHRQKISMANHSRKGLKMKKRVHIPADELRTFLNEGKSINWIALHYNCDWSTARARIYENPELMEGKK